MTDPIQDFMLDLSSTDGEFSRQAVLFLMRRLRRAEAKATRLERKLARVKRARHQRRKRRIK